MDGVFPGMTAWLSGDLFNWCNPVQAFYSAPGALSSRNIYESPYVLYYEPWGKYILFLNFGYSVSNNPLKFSGFREYLCDTVPAPEAWLENQKYFHPEIGFAGEIIQVDEGLYRSSCYGPRNFWKLKFFKVDLKADEQIFIK
jgi:hypothetical protein